MQPKHLQWLIAIIALLKIVFHLWFYDMLEPHRDELLYFSLGTHPAAGYASVPPMIGWIAYLLMKTMGFSALAIKIVPAILGGVLVWLTAQIARQLGGQWFAQILTSLAFFLVPVFIRPFYLYQPVAFDILFWTLLLYFITRFLNTHKDQYLVYFGIIAGLAILNKHLVILLLLALLISFAISNERKIFNRRSFFYAIGLCIIISLPNILWQLNHNLSGIRHLGALNKHQLVYVNRFDFLKDQLMMPGIFTLFTLSGLLALLFKKSFQKFRLLGVTILLVIAVLFTVKGKGYYTAGVFPFCLAAGAVWWETLLKKWYSRLVLGIALIALSLPLLPLGIPTDTPENMAVYFKSFTKKYGIDGMLRYENGRIHDLPQDYADMLGWEELAKLTASAYAQAPDKSRVMIYCENYGEASAVNILGRKYGLPEPVSFSDNYYYWFPRQISSTTDTFIYVNDMLGEDVSRLFADIQLIGKISNPLAREYGTQVYLCRNPRSNFSEFWNERVKEIESPF